MVYKKYIKKGGKTFGPYYYENYREGGVVKTRYIGKGAENNLWGNFLYIGLGLAFLILFLVAMFSLDLTGNVSLDIQTKYQAGEMLKGNLKFNLKEGELVPADSKIFVSFGGNNYEYFLSDLVDDKVVEGVFFVENLNISGEGEGYGMIGSKKIYPDVNFELEVIGNEKIETGIIGSDTGSSDSSSESEDEIVDENPTSEVVDENSSEDTSVNVEKDLVEDKDKKEKEEKNKDKNKESEEGGELLVEDAESATTEIAESVIESTEESSEEISGTESSTESEESSESSIGSSSDVSSESSSPSENSESGSVITGEVISESFKTITGIVSKENNFEYSLEENEDAQLIKGSVSVEGEIISDDEIKLKNKKDGIEISTNYFIEEKGFSEDYLGEEILELNIDLIGFNISINENSDLVIFLVYGGEEIISVSETISVDGTVVEENVTEIFLNESKEILTEINKTLVVENLTIETIQYGAVLNRPVKWKKVVKSENVGSIKVEIPKEAGNISVYKIEELKEELVVGISEENIEVNGNESEEIFEGKIETINEKEIVSEEVSEEISIEEIEEFNESEIVTDEKAGEENKEEKQKKVKITAKIISGEVSAEIEIEEDSLLFGFIKRIFRTLTGRVVDVEETAEIKEVLIDENATEFEIEYETPGSVVDETETGYGKEIVISSGVHYENILVYTELPLPIKKEFVKLYNIVNGSKMAVDFVGYSVKDVLENKTGVAGMIEDEIAEDVTDVNETRSSLSMTGQVVDEEIINETIVEIDNLSEDELISYIEWVVPHLSNQSYELELTILNVQSYPTVGGNWTVRFNTSGEANLTISAWNGTTYGFEYNESNLTIDLEYLETKCGENSSALDVGVVINGTEIPYDVYLKKKRIEEIRRELG